jgi:hypothetical protein
LRKFIWILFLLAGQAFAQSPMNEGQNTQEKLLLELKAEVEGLKSSIKALEARKLQCSDGKSVQGPKNKWSPWSVCPEGMQATGLARVDIQGDHEVVTNHVNDFQCGPQGCRAWCIGNPCEVIARCCK